MLKATVNQQTFNIVSDKTGTTIDEQPLDWDIVEIRNNHFHILYNNRSYNAEVLEADYQAKSFLIKMNNRQYVVNVKDRFDILLEQLGMSETASTKVNDLKAPMPGLIVSLLVQIGDSIKKGDSLLILEAMKMENVLKATGEGIIKNIKVSNKQNVEKNQVLIEFE
ncbi:MULTISPECIES: acetyl-CoA carboxylase biotin carboxyl carrier protein subunit [unclassified Arcicella]|uniref:acetyl-CoA carboxylase biotin carboxyl carrier protein subunit n=1 Tax=unclassified Arcicella TaxID=2644986 RepID=UPI00285D040B|nr:MULTISPECIES: acetyl-CoA carboxylase biotin carboxyl carrier protein subunit [unclassified Arcicella]MDR6560062.1 biotin carboxyl carrier protein [Arcicella sp. BE51]MDR6810331.1 biotin carboxyl carrier protein [Arcicella sp. BE140]MDR6821681.1 biotin carboxyl carrier protein [Arcicella sp. BE139]